MRPDGFWQKLSIDWPCAVTDWLYANSIVMLRAQLRELTLRRAIYAAAFILAILAFSQIAAAELALVFAGDAALYAEIVSLCYLAVARNHLAQGAALVRHKARRALRRPRRAFARITARARRVRRPQRPPAGDSDPAAWGWAFA